MLVGAIRQKFWHWDAHDRKPESSVGRSDAPASIPSGFCVTSTLLSCAFDTIDTSVAEQMGLGEPIWSRVTRKSWRRVVQ